MSTTDTSARRTAWWAGVLAALAVSLVLAGLLDRAGERDTAAGLLTGALAVIALAVVARRRSTRDATSAATASRVAGGEPDERDTQVLQRSLAAVGASAFVVSAPAVVAMFLGVDAERLLATLPWVFIVVGVVAFVVVDRRS